MQTAISFTGNEDGILLAAVLQAKRAGVKLGQIDACGGDVSIGHGDHSILVREDARR